jgi:hypothetical protein
MDIPPLILVIYDKSNISVVLSLFIAQIDRIDIYPKIYHEVTRA